MYFDTADERIGRISDDAIRRGYTADDLDRLAEITAHLNLSQFDHSVGTYDSELQTFRAKEQSI